MWEGPWVFCLNWSGYRDSLTKIRSDSLKWLECRLIFHLTRWRHVWILCGDPRLSPSYPPHLDMGTHIPWHLERPVEFKASKAEEAWLFLKIDWNPNISVETRNGPLISHLTSRNVCIILTSLGLFTVVSLITTQESWLRWTKWSFEGPSPL